MACLLALSFRALILGLDSYVSDVIFGVKIRENIRFQLRASLVPAVNVNVPIADSRSGDDHEIKRGAEILHLPIWTLGVRV